MPKTEFLFKNWILISFFIFLFFFQGPVLFGNAKEASPASLERLHEVLGWVRDFLKLSGFIAGTDHVTIADLAFVASYSSILAGNQIDLAQYDPDLKVWFERCKAAIPNYEEANGVGAEQWGQLLQTRATQKKGGSKIFVKNLICKVIKTKNC